MKLKSLTLMLALSVSATSIKAGGLLTNTNQSIAFLRSLARDGAIGIDGVYSNPAGVAFLPMGLHLSLSVQNVYQTRTIIVSTIQLERLIERRALQCWNG